MTDSPPHTHAHTCARAGAHTPAGRLQPDPSTAVVARTAKFGSGGAPADVLAQQARRFPDAGPKQLLLPAKYRSGSAGRAGGGASGVAGGSSDDDEHANGAPTKGRNGLASCVLVCGCARARVCGA